MCNTSLLVDHHMMISLMYIVLVCVQIRPNAVALVDAFDHTDDYLGSALGRYDGDVYSHLYKGAFKESLNDTVVVDGYEEYLKPLLTQNMWGPQSKL